MNLITTNRGIDNDNSSDYITNTYKHYSNYYSEVEIMISLSEVKRVIGDETYKCTVAYRDKYGYIIKGLALGLPVAGRSGMHYVYVDNYVNAIPLDNIVDIYRTKTKF